MNENSSSSLNLHQSFSHFSREVWVKSEKSENSTGINTFFVASENLREKNYRILKQG